MAKSCGRCGKDLTVVEKFTTRYPATKEKKYQHKVHTTKWKCNGCGRTDEDSVSDFS